MIMKSVRCHAHFSGAAEFSAHGQRKTGFIVLRILMRRPRMSKTLLFLLATLTSLAFDHAHNLVSNPDLSYLRASDIGGVWVSTTHNLASSCVVDHYLIDILAGSP